MTKATEIDKQIGEKIAIYRKIRKKNQHWLADKIKMSYQQVQNYESGKHRVAASMLLCIAIVLKVAIENFFPDEQDK